MPTYVYKGISKDQREHMLEAYMASIKPQDPRGRKPIYHIDQRDTEEVRERKKAALKKWREERKAEYAKGIEQMDASSTLVDQLGKPWVFEKGKPVKVPADSLVAKDIEAKISAPRSPFVQWEKVDEAAVQAAKPKEHAPKDQPK